jgi:hypothetical protein
LHAPAGWIVPEDGYDDLAAGDLARRRQTMAESNLNVAAVELLSELLIGPDPKWTWIVSNEPNSGVLGVLDNLSAEQASTPPAPGRRSVAAHAGHLLFSLDAATRRLRGENPELDWDASWNSSAVTSAEWDRLRRDLRAELERLQQVILEHRGDWEPMALKGIIATVGHTAYHLGAIRQILPAARGRVE